MTTADAAGGGQFDSSAQTRLVLWQDAIALFKRNPITGTGFETYEFMGRVGPYRDTHNYYVKVLAETGVVGMILYLALLWKLLGSGSRLFYGSEDPFWQAVGLGFLALVFCAIALNFFGDRWTYQQVDGYLWVFLGCVIRGLVVLNERREPGQTDAVAELSPDEVQVVAV
jgi:O-antigen ligase